MKIGSSVDIAALSQRLDAWEKKQLPFATSLAMNRTGQKMVKSLQAGMRYAFDRPTPYTLNSVYMSPSTKTNLVVEINLKNFASKGTAPSVYLAPQVQGGIRQQKRSEKWMQQAGFLPGGMYMTPGSGAKLDGYGNMSRGQLIQMLSALQALPEAGYLANRTKRSAARNHNQPQFFVGRPGGGHLPLGVWQRTSQGLKPILIFIRQPQYKISLPFYSILGDAYTANFQNEFNAALRDALIFGGLNIAA